jgi:hypothetical protein
VAGLGAKNDGAVFGVGVRYPVLNIFDGVNRGEAVELGIGVKNENGLVVGACEREG